MNILEKKSYTSKIHIKSHINRIIMMTAIATLATISCNKKKQQELWFKTPPPLDQLSPTINVSSIKNRHDKNTVPYIASHTISYYGWFKNIMKSKNMESLDTNRNIVLDDNAWESEKEAHGWDNDANSYVYLNRTATSMLLDIQNELNEKMKILWYQNIPIFLQINSASRSHDAQVYLANNEKNATNTISAHESGIAVDISTSQFFYTAEDGQKYEIKNRITIQAINKILHDIFIRDCNKKFFITPESSWIIHIVFLIYGLEYNPEEKLKHPRHRKH